MIQPYIVYKFFNFQIAFRQFLIMVFLTYKGSFISISRKIVKGVSSLVFSNIDSSFIHSAHHGI